MAEDEDKPEDDIEDDDDSDLFQPPPPEKPEQEDGESDQASADAPGDPLGDALAQGAGDTEEGAGDENDSELFEQPAEDPPAEESPPEEEPAEEDTTPGTDAAAPGADIDEDQAADLFGDSPASDQDEDEDENENENEDEDEESDDEYGGARQRYPWLQRSGEEEEVLEEEHFLQGRALIIVGAGVVFVIFAALIWFLYAQGGDAPRDEEVALIEAPEGPAKVEPEDRGGMEIPDQDKLVFDRVSGQETPLEDTLLAGPEETAALPEDMPEALPETPETPETMNQLADALVQEGATPDAAAEDDNVAAAPEEEPAAVEAPAVATETAPPPVTSAPVTRAIESTHVVQLGSFGSVERAETAWLVMKNRHSITLAGLGSDIQRADLGARGIFYRLRTEALGSDDAQDLCADLKADGQDCLVVRK